MRVGLALLWFLGACLVGSAQADDEVFRLDAVFVSVFRTEDPADEPAARAIEARLVRALGERHLVVPLDDVPPFEDYSAEVYLRSCAREHLAGCAYVIGARGGADWAVDGFVEFVPGTSIALVQTTIVDVARVREVVTFQVRLDGSNDAAWAGAVASMIDRLSGQDEPDDLRELDKLAAAEREARRRALEREAVAQSLEALMGSPERVELRDDRRLLEPPRVTASQIARYRRQEGAPPWERVGLTASQYRRYRNSAVDLASFRERLAGRAGRVIVRGALGGGRTAGRVSYDARWAIDPVSTQIVGLEATTQVAGGGAFGGELEVGLGLLSWLDVSVGIGSRAGRHDWLVHAESTERPREPQDRVVTSASDLEIVARVTVAPLPLGPVRPLILGGVGWWGGPRVTKQIDFSTVPSLGPPKRPSALRPRLGGGVEVDASAAVRLFARAEVVVPLGSGLSQRSEQGDPARIVYRDDRALSRGPGVVGAVGVAVLSGPLWGGRADRVRP